MRSGVEHDCDAIAGGNLVPSRTVGGGSVSGEEHWGCGGGIAAAAGGGGVASQTAGEGGVEEHWGCGGGIAAAAGGGGVASQTAGEGGGSDRGLDQCCRMTLPSSHCSWNVVVYGWLVDHGCRIASADGDNNNNMHIYGII